VHGVDRPRRDRIQISKFRDSKAHESNAERKFFVQQLPGDCDDLFLLRDFVSESLVAGVGLEVVRLGKTVHKARRQSEKVDIGFESIVEELPTHLELQAVARRT
jgi:hypothetical protein